MAEKRQRRRGGYTFDGQYFPTQQAAKSAIQSILYSQPLGEPLAPAHLNFMMAVLEHHPAADIKIGCGVARIEVRANTRFSTGRTFWLVRHDGTATDFSFMECLKPSTNAQKVQGAFREAIGDQLATFKLDWFRTQAQPDTTVLCPILNISVGWEDAHVDHERPLTFVALVEAFISTRQLNVDDIAVRDREDGRIGKVIADELLAAEWAAYHRAQAKLRVVSKQANLGWLRRLDAADTQRQEEDDA